jgi:hypothetical protein
MEIRISISRTSTEILENTCERIEGGSWFYESTDGGHAFDVLTRFFVSEQDTQVITEILRERDPDNISPLYWPQEPQPYKVIPFQSLSTLPYNPLPSLHDYQKNQKYNSDLPHTFAVVERFSHLEVLRCSLGALEYLEVVEWLQKAGLSHEDRNMIKKRAISFSSIESTKSFRPPDISTPKPVKETSFIHPKGIQVGSLCAPSPAPASLGQKQKKTQKQKQNHKSVRQSVYSFVDEDA